MLATTPSNTNPIDFPRQRGAWISSLVLESPLA
jgi:hypothetical protein